jgi:hypothetical protein
MAIDGIGSSRARETRTSQAQETSVAKTQEQPKPAARNEVRGHSTQDVFDTQRPQHTEAPHVHPHDPVPGPGDGTGTAGTHEANPAEAKKAGEELVNKNTQWQWLPPGFHTDTVAVTNDILAIARDPSHTEAEKSAVLQGALDELSSEDRKKVATSLADHYKNDLPQFSRRGLETLKSALGTGDDTKALRESLQKELDARPPVREVMVNGVKIVGEVSQEAIDAAAEEVRRLTANPEVAASMKDYTIIITPRGKEATDSDHVFEQLGLHGLEVAGQPGRSWDSVSGGAGGRVLYFNEDDAVDASGKPGSLNTLNQEFGHAVKFNYANNLPADDARLTALLEPGTKVTDSDGNGTINGADTLKIAFEQRLAKGNINADYAKLNQEEWFSLAAAAFNGPAGSSHFGGAQWLYDNDLELYNLMESIHGATRQSVTTEPPPESTGPGPR